MTKFISMSGKKGSGKDTAAEILRNQLEEFDVHVAITHFADPIKNIGTKLFGIPRELIYGSDDDKNTPCDVLWDGLPDAVRLKYSTNEQKHPPEITVGGDIIVRKSVMPRTGNMTIREFLQVLGTDIFRERVYYNVWAEAPFKKKWKEDVVIVADCRFPNEVDATLAAGGHIIRLERDAGLGGDTHLSETALDDYNWNQVGCEVYQNNGTIEELGDFLSAWTERSRI